MIRLGMILSITAVLLGSSGAEVNAQSFGVELHNTQMPASGGMAGTSIARPQDAVSALNGNPASLTQYDGTHFTFGGSIIDASVRFNQTGSFPAASPLVTPFNATSSYPASVLGNIGVTHEMDVMGQPIVAGLGFVSNAGAGTSFAGVNASNGTASSLLVLELVASVGTKLTDDLSIGASFQFGTSFLDAPFVGIGRNTLDYAGRGSFGLNYEAGADTTIGAYFQTKQKFIFKDAVLLELAGGVFTPALDINLDLPRNFGVGVANSSLMNGNLLLAADVLYKNWDDTDLFRSIYNDQWVLQLGAQLTQGKTKWRAGYAFAENPVQSPPAASIGRVTPPGLVAAASFVQAQLAVIGKHRISGGVGVTDIIPNVDLDVAVGGMLHESQQLATTNIGISSYWISFGLTWHFGKAACCSDDCGCGDTCGQPATLGLH